MPQEHEIERVAGGHARKAFTAYVANSTMRYMDVQVVHATEYDRLLDVLRTRDKHIAELQAQLLDGREAFIADVIQTICDFDDRNSPEDQPDMLLVTADELRSVMLRSFESADYFATRA